MLLRWQGAVLAWWLRPVSLFPACIACLLRFLVSWRLSPDPSHGHLVALCPACTAPVRSCTPLHSLKASHHPHTYLAGVLSCALRPSASPPHGPTHASSPVHPQSSSDRDFHRHRSSRGDGLAIQGLGGVGAHAVATRVATHSLFILHCRGTEDDGGRARAAPFFGIVSAGRQQPSHLPPPSPGPCGQEPPCAEEERPYQRVFGSCACGPLHAAGPAPAAGGQAPHRAAQQPGGGGQAGEDCRGGSSLYNKGFCVCVASFVVAHGRVQQNPHGFFSTRLWRPARHHHAPACHGAGAPGWGVRRGTAT